MDKIYTQDMQYICVSMMSARKRDDHKYMYAYVQIKYICMYLYPQDNVIHLCVDD